MGLYLRIVTNILSYVVLVSSSQSIDGEVSSNELTYPLWFRFIRLAREDWYTPTK